MSDPVLPKGDDLMRTLRVAFPNHAYALYGLEVEQILTIVDSETMEVPPPNTLAWLDAAPAPTKEQLAQAWATLQTQAPVVPLNVNMFLTGVYADPNLRAALARANPIIFTMVLRLLDASEPNFAYVQASMADLRASMTPDFTAAQLTKLTALAAQFGLPITFT